MSCVDWCIASNRFLRVTVAANSVIGESATARLSQRVARQLGRAATRVQRAEHAVAIVGDRALQRRDAPFSFAHVAPLVAQSRLAGGIAQAWRRLMTAVMDSDTAAVVRRAVAVSARVPLEDRVRRGAAAVAIAAVTHVLLLVLAQPYPYPSRAALFLPITTAIVASLVAVMSRAVAHAITDRRDH
jgi:hypothetical protein